LLLIKFTVENDCSHLYVQPKRVQRGSQFFLKLIFSKQVPKWYHYCFGSEDRMYDVMWRPVAALTVQYRPTIDYA